MRRAIILMAILFLSVGLSTILLLHQPAPSRSPGNSASVIVIIEHYRNGELVNRLVKENDLILENFAKLLLKIISQPPETVWFTKIDGGSYGSSSTSVLMVNQDTAMIHLGNGTSAVSVTDYKLASEVRSEIVGEVGCSTLGNKVNATASASFTFTESYTIKEIGLSLAIAGKSSSPTWYRILICRDDISSNPITVQAGDTLTVTYIFQLN